METNVKMNLLQLVQAQPLVQVLTVLAVPFMVWVLIAGKHLRRLKLSSGRMRKREGMPSRDTKAFRAGCGKNVSAHQYYVPCDMGRKGACRFWAFVAIV